MASRNLLKLGALDSAKTAILLCDIQETFSIHVKHFGEVVKVANKMMEAAKHLKIPVYVSEQYPKGLGPTTKDIKVEDATFLYPKTTFSMYTPELKERLQKDVPDLKSIILCGIEAHVCIEQTVIDLLSQDLSVHLLADGVSSRSLMDRGLALQKYQENITGAFRLPSLLKRLRPAIQDYTKLIALHSPKAPLKNYTISKILVAERACEQVSAH